MATVVRIRSAVDSSAPQFAPEVPIGLPIALGGRALALWPVHKSTGICTAA